jgi:predicted DNA binding CopG/RHH family protein
MASKPKFVPVMTTDAEAEAFLEQDLSDLDRSQFKPLTWESAPKSARVNMRLPEALITAIKARAKARGVPYQRLIREALERELGRWGGLRGGRGIFGGGIQVVQLWKGWKSAIEDFAGCAIIISHDRFFLDRMCTHILTFEGDAHVEWFEGNFEAYEEDKVRRLGPESIEPKRVKYKRFAR